MKQTESINNAARDAGRYYVITPSNCVSGPFESLEDAQCDIPDSHGEPMHDHVTDTKACIANLKQAAGIGESEIEHVESWVADASDDPDNTGYFIFKVEQ